MARWRWISKWMSPQWGRAHPGQWECVIMRDPPGRWQRSSSRTHCAGARSRQRSHVARMTGPLRTCTGLQPVSSRRHTPVLADLWWPSRGSLVLGAVRALRPPFTNYLITRRCVQHHPQLSQGSTQVTPAKGARPMWLSMLNCDTIAPADVCLASLSLCLHVLTRNLAHFYHHLTSIPITSTTNAHLISTSEICPVYASIQHTVSYICWEMWYDGIVLLPYWVSKADAQ